MKIFVKSRQWMENQLQNNPEWFMNKWIISIFSSHGNKDYSPFPDRYNICKLQFDDVTEIDPDECHFSVELAIKLIDFINQINSENKPIYIHCDAGVSRSGAIGYLLNEWYNKYLKTNEADKRIFEQYNSHIMPNPEVVRILKRAMFGIPYSGIYTNDYTFNEDGERIDNIQEVH